MLKRNNMAINQNNKSGADLGFGLERALGLKELVAIEVGQTIGAGVFTLTAVAASMCGPAVPLAFVISAIPVGFMMLTLASLGAALPTVGGSYRYPSRLFSPGWAFLGVWGYALGMVLGLFPLLALTCTNYLKAIWPGIPVTGFSIGLLTFFYAANLFGIGIAAMVQNLMVVVMLVALFTFPITGLPHVHFEYFTPFMPFGAGGLLAASALLTFANIGANAVIELGGEIKNPGRNLPLSLLISIPLVVFIYVLIAIVTVGVLPYQEIVKANEQGLAAAAHVFMSTGLFSFFIIGGAVLAITTTLHSTFMWATKSMMILSADGLFPKVMVRIHPKYKTPWYFLTTIWALSVFAIIVGVPLKLFANYAAIGGLIVFIPVMLSAMVLKKRRPDAYEKAPFKLTGALYWIAPSFGVLLTFISILILLYDTTMQFGKWSLIVYLGWLIFGGFLYLFLRDRIEKAAGKSIKEIMAEDRISD